jgi:prenyltransferase beta subunit
VSPRRTPELTDASTAEALKAAGSYLAREQEPAGPWGDFMLLAEQSLPWVTGYVGWTLNRSRGDADLSRAAAWLLANRSPGVAWGYNGHWPQDADSIAHVLLFLSERGDVKRDQWAGALEALLAHQAPDGGFATIMDAEAWLRRFRSPTDDLRGWTESHPCVTAVIARLLVQLDGGRHRAQAARALDWLRSCQRPSGYWDAYWWQGRLYTTARALQALRAAEEPPGSPALAAARDWVLGSQLADGGWSADDQESGQAFHTALAIQALCALAPDDRLTDALERGLGWLVSAQLEDGSWPVVPILRVPHPRTLHPWRQSAWRVSILGLDVVVPDWHRVFTTATAIQALQAHAEIARRP